MLEKLKMPSSFLLRNQFVRRQALRLSLSCQVTDERQSDAVDSSICGTWCALTEQFIIARRLQELKFIVHISPLCPLLLHANALLSVTNLPLPNPVKEVRGRHNGSGSPSAKTLLSKFPANVSKCSCFGLSSGPDPVLEANGSTAPRSRRKKVFGHLYTFLVTRYHSLDSHW